MKHSELTNLTVGDPHTRYAALAGRGGQTIQSDVEVTKNVTTDAIKLNPSHPYSYTKCNSWRRY